MAPGTIFIQDGSSIRNNSYSDSNSEDNDINNDSGDVDKEDDDQSMKEDDGGDNNDPYKNLDEDIALALCNDDAKIAALEQKLGLSSNSSKAKKKLRKEFAKAFSGYGENFGDFIDNLNKLDDNIGMRRGAMEASSGGEDDKSMNSEYNDNCIDDSDSNTEDTPAADHDVSLTYHPTIGEDIYGNKIDSSHDQAFRPSKYAPPHLRKKPSNQEADGTAPTDNHYGVSKSVQVNHLDVLSTYPFHDVNDCLWKNIPSACVPPHMIMSGLIPLYIRAISGVH